MSFKQVNKYEQALRGLFTVGTSYILATGRVNKRKGRLQTGIEVVQRCPAALNGRLS